MCRFLKLLCNILFVNQFHEFVTCIMESGTQIVIRLLVHGIHFNRYNQITALKRCKSVLILSDYGNDIGYYKHVSRKT